LYNLKESEKFTTPVIRSRKLEKAFERVPKDLSERRTVHFKEMMRVHTSVVTPGADVRRFYDDQRAGFRGFTGKPYRYSTSATSHIWLKVLSHKSGAPLLSQAKINSSWKGNATSPSRTNSGSGSGSPSKRQRKERQSRGRERSGNSGVGGGVKGRSSKERMPNPLTL